MHRYNVEGFAVFKGVLPAGRVNEVLIDACEVFACQMGYLGYGTEDGFDENLKRMFREQFDRFQNCGKQVQHLISLHRFGVSNVMVELLKQFGLEHPVICTRPVVYFNHPQLAKEKIYHTVDAHQDWRSMQGSSNALVIWVPLIDIDKKLGALQVLPRSHTQGLRTSHVEKGFGMVQLTEEDERNFVDVEVEVGDAVVFHSMLVHRSGDNIMPGPRWSCHFRYNDLYDKEFIKRGYLHPYIYKPIETLL